MLQETRIYSFTTYQILCCTDNNLLWSMVKADSPELSSTNSNTVTIFVVGIYKFKYSNFICYDIAHRAALHSKHSAECQWDKAHAREGVAEAAVANQKCLR